MSDIVTPNSPAEAPLPELTYAPPVVTPEKSAAHQRLEVRLWCAFVFAMCAGMLGVALYLRPDPFGTGTGTHQQLGLAPCNWQQTLGIPCPTCGCTTAVAYFAHAHPLKSFLTQPFGFAVALLATLLLPLTFWGLLTGQWKGPSMFTLGWYWQWLDLREHRGAGAGVGVQADYRTDEYYALIRSSPQISQITQITEDGPRENAKRLGRVCQVEMAATPLL